MVFLYYIFLEKSHVIHKFDLKVVFFSQRWKKKQLFQLFNQFFRKCILNWLFPDKKSAFLHQRNVKFKDYLRIISSPAGEGCVRDSVLILIVEFPWDFFFYFLFFYVELFAVHRTFLIFLNFSTGVRLCLGVILVGLLYSIGRFFLRVGHFWGQPG